ncbi:TPA: ComEC family protein [Raoultella planticola]
MRLPQLAGCAICGILPLLLLPDLPTLATVQGAVVGALLVALYRRTVARYLALTMLFFAWGILHAQQALWPTQALAGGSRQIEVELSAVDGETTFQGNITRLNGRRLFPAPGITFYGSPLPKPPCAGQRWRMTARIRPIHSQLNEGGFDGQRYALAQHRALTGRFTSAEALDLNCSLRARYLASLEHTLTAFPWQSVILGLGMGERLVVPGEIKVLMQETGTSHLMAISGLHIALGALLGGLAVRGLQFFLPCRWIGWQMPLLTGLACALFYAWLTGMQPPALRTCVALGAGVGLRLSGRRWSPWQIWGCGIAAILFADPLAVLSDSLWLSVFAVATLIFWYQLVPISLHACRWPLRQILALCHLQFGLMFLLLPLQIVLFHGMSMTSWVANLVAVPLVTFVIVPLILGAMVVHLCGPVPAEMALWLLADRLLAGLFWFLRLLPQGWLSLDFRWAGVSVLPWLMLLVWRFHAWRSLPAVCLSSTVLLSWPFWRHQPPDEWRVTMLDVGQGLALVIERQGAAILYDTGLAWPDGDSGRQIIIPWLRWHNLRPEGIILSHEHLDHRGGLNSLLEAWPALWVRSPLGWAGHQACRRGESWQWRGLTFRALWPLPGSRATGNNRSCVVRIDDGKRSILLTGDIEIPAERAMLSHYWQHLASTLIQVPHHGSNTSSSLALLQRTGGAAALASLSRYNAWHMPSEKVIQRYRQQGYQWFDTPHQGQMTVTFSAEGWQIHGLRDQLLPRWYHQWFGETADNG